MGQRDGRLSLAAGELRLVRSDADQLHDQVIGFGAGLVYAGQVILLP